MNVPVNGEEREDVVAIVRESAEELKKPESDRAESSDTFGPINYPNQGEAVDDTFDGSEDFDQPISRRGNPVE